MLLYSYTSTNNNTGLNWNNANDNYAWSFTPTKTGVPTQIVLRNQSVTGTPTGNVYIKSDKTIGSTTLASGSFSGMVAGANYIQLTGGITLVAGTQYWVYFQRTSNSSNYPRIYNELATPPTEQFWRSSASNINPDTRYDGPSANVGISMDIIGNVLTYGEYLGAGSSTTKLLLHLNGNSVDSSGNGNNGTDSNITYVDGKFGKCASFRSNYDSYINIPNLGIGTNDFTINFIIKPANFVEGNCYYFSANASSSPWNELRLLQAPSTSAGLRVNHYNGSSDIAVEVNSSKISTTQPNYITVTRISDTLSIYVNGKLEASGTGWSGRNCSGGYRQMIGKINDASAGDSFYGLMDECIVELGGWSAARVKKHYTYQKGQFGIL